MRVARLTILLCESMPSSLKLVNKIFVCCEIRVLNASPRLGGILNSRRGIPIFTNSMLFLECNDIALFEV